MTDISTITKTTEWNKDLLRQSQKEAEQARKKELEADRERQELYIAAYSNRKPEEVTAEELDNPTEFWIKTPELFADYLRGSAAQDVKTMLTHNLENGGPFSSIYVYGVDLMRAYDAYSDQGRALVREALAEKDTVYTRPYAKATILPYLKSYFLDSLSEQAKSTIGCAFRLQVQPSSELATFQLFCMLYSLADAKQQELMAQITNCTPGQIDSYISQNQEPETVRFPAPVESKDQDDTSSIAPSLKEMKAKIDDADRDMAKKLAQHCNDDHYSVSMDISNAYMLGKRFNQDINADDGHVTFKLIELNEGQPESEPGPLVAEDMLVAVAWESLRRAGASYITPLDIWHKIFWGATDQNSKGSETEKQLLKGLAAGKGALQDIVNRIDRLMNIKVVFRYYDKRPWTKNMKMEIKQFIIPHIQRVRLPGYRNKIVWETIPLLNNKEIDDATAFPYRLAMLNNRLIQFPAEQIDFRRLGIDKNCTLRAATTRDVILKIAANAQSHGGELEITGWDQISKYGQLEAGDEAELAQAKTPAERRKIKNRQNMRRNFNAQTAADIETGLQNTGVIEDITESDGKGAIKGKTTIKFNLKETGKKRGKLKSN